MKQGRVDLSTFDNGWYRPGGLIRRAMWFLAGRLFVNTYLPLPVSVKRFILRLFGAKIGQGVVIKPKVNIKYPWFLKVGDNVWIGECAWIDNLGRVSIGDNCVLSQSCMLLCGSHDYKKSSFDLIVGDIVLHEGVWIGAKAVVCPSVTAKSHAVLTAGSTATKDLEEYAVYKGNPAVKVRDRIIEH